MSEEIFEYSPSADDLYPDTKIGYSMLMMHDKHRL